MSTQHSFYATNPSAWKGTDFASPDDYTITLTQEDQAEVRAGVGNIELQGRLVPAHALSRVDFPFPSLGEKLSKGFSEVRAGKGFVLIRGIPYEGWTLVQYTAAVRGIGAYFGYLLSQNAQGELIGHVVDATREDPTPRMYRSNLELGLHNDPTAMLSLACWNPSLSGGVSVFASAVTIHQEIKERAPYLLEPLYRGFHYHRLGEQGPDEEPVTPYRVPVFAVRNNQVSCRNIRAGYIAGHHELGIPITDEELDAIDLFDDIAREPENHVVIALQRGDMVVINNYTVMHARTRFEDAQDPASKRHLLRLWLDADNFRDVPNEFNQFRTNGVPYQAGRKCTYDFKKLFEEVRPELLGRKPDRKGLSEIIKTSAYQR